MPSVKRWPIDVSWSNYVSAGSLTLQVVAKRPSYDSTAYYITAEAQTQGVISKLYTLYYKADTLIDAFSMLPQRGSVYSREGRRQRTKITTFDHARKRGQFELANRHEGPEGRRVGRRDAGPALGNLRAAEPSRRGRAKASPCRSATAASSTR